MPTTRVKQPPAKISRRVVHKSTAGISNPIPEAVDLVGNAPNHLTSDTVALPQLKTGEGQSVLHADFQ
jgi:hypothetical protein